MPIPKLPDELIELHLHINKKVAPHILFEIAHEQKFKLPIQNYFEFITLITSDPTKIKNLKEYLMIIHK